MVAAGAHMVSLALTRLYVDIEVRRVKPHPCNRARFFTCLPLDVRGKWRVKCEMELC